MCEALCSVLLIYSHKKWNISIRYAEGFFIKLLLWNLKCFTTDKGWNVLDERAAYVNIIVALEQISSLMLTLSFLFMYSRFRKFLAASSLNNISISEIH